MPSAIEYLDAFKTSFNTKDASRLDALLGENFTFRNSSKTAEEPIPVSYTHLTLPTKA